MAMRDDPNPRKGSKAAKAIEEEKLKAKENDDTKLSYAAVAGKAFQRAGDEVKIPASKVNPPETETHQAGASPSSLIKAKHDAMKVTGSAGQDDPPRKNEEWLFQEPKREEPGPNPVLPASAPEADTIDLTHESDSEDGMKSEGSTSAVENREDLEDETRSVSTGPMLTPSKRASSRSPSDSPPDYRLGPGQVKEAPRKIRPPLKKPALAGPLEFEEIQTTEKRRRKHRRKSRFWKKRLERFRNASRRTAGVTRTRKDRSDHTGIYLETYSSHCPWFRFLSSYSEAATRKRTFTRRNAPTVPPRSSRTTTSGLRRRTKSIVGCREPHNRKNASCAKSSSRPRKKRSTRTALLRSQRSRSPNATPKRQRNTPGC